MEEALGSTHRFTPGRRSQARLLRYSVVLGSTLVR